MELVLRDGETIAELSGLFLEFSGEGPVVADALNRSR